MCRVASSPLLLETKRKPHLGTGQTLGPAGTGAVAPWPCRGTGQQRCLSPSLPLLVPSAGEGALLCGAASVAGRMSGDTGPVRSRGQQVHWQCPSHRGNAPRAGPWEGGQPALNALTNAELLSTAAALLQARDLPKWADPRTLPDPTENTAMASPRETYLPFHT